MQNRIVPVGLKGKEITERMIQLMGITPINENRKTSVVELTKKGPDGKIYGIVRENHEYYIKTTNKTKDLVVEDFTYIGGLKNKKSEAYSSYAKAIKQLNLKFKSLNEAYGVSENINVFESDRLLKEDVAGFYQPTGSGFSNEGNMEGHNMSECCGAPMMEGMCSECGGTGMYNGMGGMEEESMKMDEFDKPTMDKFKDQYGDKRGQAVYYATANKQDRDPETFEKNEGFGMEDEGWGMEEGYDLDEVNQAVQDMMDEEEEMSAKDKEFAALAKPYDKITYADKIAGAKMHENKLSIARSIEQMDDIIDYVLGGKKKVYTLK